MSNSNLKFINATKLQTPNISTETQLRITPNMLMPAASTVQREVVEEHDSEPIKDLADVNRISQYLIANKRYRDNMLWIVGINFGLRVSDLLQLRFCDIIDENYQFKTTFAVWEQKTRNTRKVARNRYITINQAVKEAVTLYLTNVPSNFDDYLFRSESPNAPKNKPLHSVSVERILKGIKADLGLKPRMATHTLRKTFGYHQMAMSNNDPRKLLLLQKMFGHSSTAVTLRYIGITEEEIEDAYLNLNLGLQAEYQAFSKVEEVA